MKYWFKIFYLLMIGQFASAQTNVTISDTICMGSVYNFPDTSFQINTFTIYDYLKIDPVNNNDTLFHYEINLWTPYMISFPVVSCALDSFEVEYGVYIYNINNDTTVNLIYSDIHGCDSIESYVFTIFPKYRDTVIHQICYGGTVVTRDSTFLENLVSDTIYESIFPTSFLCDSTYYEIIDVEVPKSSNINAKVCYLDNYIAVDGDTIFEITRDTIYIARFPIINACDSLVFINIDLTEIDTTVTRNGPILKANLQTGVSYQWIDCVTGLPIPGATGTTFLIPNNGQYKVRMTKDGCVQFSDCHAVFNHSASNTPNEIIRFNNPVHDILNLHHSKSLQYRIYTQDGRLIDTGEDNRIDMSRLSQGSYFLHLPSENLKFVLIKI